MTIILLFLFLLPFQDDETDVSEEVKKAWVSSQPVRWSLTAQGPCGFGLLACVQLS